MGKTKQGLKQSSSSKAVGPRQKWAKSSAQSATELSGNQCSRIYCLSHNEHSCYFSKHWQIHLFERNIVEKSEVSRLLIESSGENSLLNEHSKTLMLKIGNKYPFDASKKTLKRNCLKESTLFNAMEITLKQ